MSAVIRAQSPSDTSQLLVSNDTDSTVIDLSSSNLTSTLLRESVGAGKLIQITFDQWKALSAADKKLLFLTGSLDLSASDVGMLDAIKQFAATAISAGDWARASTGDFSFLGLSKDQMAALGATNEARARRFMDQLTAMDPSLKNILGQSGDIDYVQVVFMLFLMFMKLKKELDFVARGVAVAEYKTALQAADKRQKAATEQAIFAFAFAAFTVGLGVATVAFVVKPSFFIPKKNVVTPSPASGASGSQSAATNSVGGRDKTLDSKIDDWLNSDKVKQRITKQVEHQMDKEKLVGSARNLREIPLRHKYEDALKEQLSKAAHPFRNVQGVDPKESVKAGRRAIDEMGNDWLKTPIGWLERRTKKADELASTLLFVVGQPIGQLGQPAGQMHAAPITHEAEKLDADKDYLRKQGSDLTSDSEEMGRRGQSILDNWADVASRRAQVV